MSKHDDAKRILTDIKTHEVSFVDQGANEEEFLIIKTKGGVDKLKLSEKEVNLFKTTINQVIDEGILNDVEKEDVIPVEKQNVSIVDNVNKAFEKLSDVKKSFDELCESGDDIIISDDIQKDIQQVTSLLSGVKDGSVETKKAGRKLSGSRVKKLKDMLIVLQSLINETDTEGGDAKVEKNNDVKDDSVEDVEKGKDVETKKVKNSEEVSNVTKAKDDSDSEILKAIGTLTKTVEGFSERLEKVETGTPVRKSANEGEDKSDEDVDVEKNKPNEGLFDNIISM